MRGKHVSIVFLNANVLLVRVLRSTFTKSKYIYIFKISFAEIQPFVLPTNIAGIGINSLTSSSRGRFDSMAFVQL